MSVDFSNAYQEILLDNLFSVIKQNFVFQTQLKLVEKNNKDKDDLQKKVDELNTLFNNAKNEVQQLQGYKVKAEQNLSAHEEKNRIQAALNDLMKKNTSLQKELEEKNSLFQKNLKEKEDKINSLQDYVKILESNVAASKLKKLNSTKVVELPLVENGSSF
jgi:chromosome segregation ATPase